MEANKFYSAGNGKTDHHWRSQRKGLRCVYNKLDCSIGMRLSMCWRESFLVCYFDCVFVILYSTTPFSGLEYLGQKGFVHTQIAAMNVFMNEKCAIKLGSFAHCKRIGSKLVYFIQSETFTYQNIFILEIGISTAILIVFHPRLSRNKKMARLRWGSNRTSTLGLLDFSFWKW